MAEKEERIFIGFINPEGDACPVPYGKCNSLCDNCQGGITRQEAIEKMAKAICMKEMFGCERCDYGKNKEKCEAWIAFSYMNTAESALNALLEDK